MIVDYDYYKNTYHGTNDITEKFESLEMKASSKVNMLIMNKDYTNWYGKDYTEQVKNATCSVIDILFEIEENKARQKGMTGNSNPIITSEKVGDYSRNLQTVTYKELKEQIAEEKERIIKEVSNYLWNTGLMNRSVPYVR